MVSKTAILVLALGLMAACNAAPSMAQSPDDDIMFDAPQEQFEEPVRRRRLRDVESYDQAQAEEPQLSPSDAAAIAQDAVPGARVLKVKLLPSGDYAVTVRVKGSVVRVVVSGVDGSIL
jgi:uncharacterized membrane protein YkoI